MRRKSLVITIIVVFLVVGCKKEDLPKDIRDQIPFDEIPPPIENRYFKVYAGPDTVKRGEGIYIGVESLRNRSHVYATFPDPNNKDQTLRIHLDRYKNTAFWSMPIAWLHRDGRVVYGSKPNGRDVIEGERAIYTLFDWDDDTIPIRIDDGSRDIWIEINVRGSLKENIIIRPVDPRHPFFNGVPPVWEKHLDVFKEIADWWTS